PALGHIGRYEDLPGRHEISSLLCRWPDDGRWWRSSKCDSLVDEFVGSHNDHDRSPADGPLGSLFAGFQNHCHGMRRRESPALGHGHRAAILRPSGPYGPDQCCCFLAGWQDPRLVRPQGEDPVVEDEGPRGPLLRGRPLRAIESGTASTIPPERRIRAVPGESPEASSKLEWDNMPCLDCESRPSRGQPRGYQSIPGDLEYLSPQPVRSQCGFVLVNSMKRRIEVAGIVQPFS